MNALLLDAAGTLFDLAEPVGQVYARFARQHGLAIDSATVESRFREVFQDLPAPHYQAYADGHDCEFVWWRELVLQVTGFPEDETFDRFFGELFAFYERPEAWCLFPDTLPFLAAARKRYRLAVVSNFDQRLIPIVEGLRLTPYFEFILSSSETRAQKPDPQIFRLALQKLNLPAEDVLHIGDSRTADYEGARRAGLRAFHLQREKGQALPDALS